jgi:hypothetical protein
LGTSKDWPRLKNASQHGIIDPDCSNNPVFCEWSVAYLGYCDGTSYTGDLASPQTVPAGPVSPIYFRGGRVFAGFVAHLVREHALADAKEVVLAGHSAGGLGAYYHADSLRATLPPSVQFGAIPDAGFFLDHADVHGKKIFGEAMRAVLSLQSPIYPPPLL